MTDLNKPDILVFCNGWLYIAFIGGDRCLNKMKEKASVHHASYYKLGEPARMLYQFPSPRAILIIYPDITESEYLSRQVVDYVKNRGGTVILGRYFAASDLIQPTVLNKWLRDSWGVPWRTGRYDITTVLLQDSHTGLGTSTRAQLVASYSCEARLLKNVSPSDSLYVSPENARSQLTVRPGPVEAQTAIAFGRCGQGWLGYAGDVGNEEGTGEALLAMMGLLE
ncbi:hypothetical protein F4680DRAFT_454269 [Xylaria scruposa]|nr:hypothetical protein F4680DRAFT_454269 [Xylaria scruposa]